MRVGEIFREVRRNLVSSSLRTTIMVAAFLGLLVPVVLSELDSTQRLIEFQNSFVARGGNVGVAYAEARLPRHRCERLSDLPYVLWSGSVSRGSTVDFASAPGTPFQTGQPTLGALRLWTRKPYWLANSQATGPILGLEAAKELGVRPGGWVSLQGSHPTKVAGVLDSVRTPQMGRWLFELSVPAGTADECWVEFSPGDLEAGLGVLDASFAAAGDSLRVQPLVQLDEFSVDVVKELDQRPQAKAWLPSAGGLIMVTWLSVWFRRSDIALYRALGLRSVLVYVVGAIEVLAVLAISSVGALLWSLVVWETFVAEVSPDQIAIAARTMFSASLLALLLAPLPWSIIGHRGTLAALLKTR